MNEEEIKLFNNTIINMRCIHCLNNVKESDGNRDHVFPSSWYPDDTPEQIQRWTAPSCKTCNASSGVKEEKLFSRLALGTNPQSIASSGIAERALRSYGVRAGILSPKEENIRLRHRQKILKEITDFSGDSRPLARSDNPLTPWDGRPPVVIPIDPPLLDAVYKKIIRGCEYVLGNERYVEEPYEITIYDGTVAEKFKELSSALPVTATLGPGFRIRRGSATEDPLSVVYEITFWGNHEILAIIIFPEASRADA